MEAERSSASLGIGITTFNRRRMLEQCIARVREHTKRPYVLFVADDGSTDETRAFLEQSGVAYVSSANRGIAWNKNRGLYALHEIMGCERIIMLEDDTFPIGDSWENDWIEAIDRYGHINLNPSHWDLTHHGGAGTPDDPYLGEALTGQCNGFSREALSLVGYVDTRFRLYGYEHAEHTERFMRGGFGGKSGSDGSLTPFLIDSLLQVEGLDKPPDLHGIHVNGGIYDSIKADEIRRNAWRGDEEMLFFRADMACMRGKGGQPFLAPVAALLDSEHAKLAFSDGRVSTGGNGSGKWRVDAMMLGGSLSLCLRDKNEGPAAGWLQISRSGQDWAVVPKELATIFEIVYRQQEGFGIRHDGLFLCCELAGSRCVTLSRANLSDWETFRLSTQRIFSRDKQV